MRNVVTHLPFTYTGADFYALCTDAMLNAIKRKIANLQADLGAGCWRRAALVRGTRSHARSLCPPDARVRVCVRA